MSEETPRDASPEAPAVAREPEAAQSKSGLTPPPAVPRPRASGAAPPSRQQTGNNAAAGAPSSPSSQIPPPAPMPRVPGMDAFMASPVVAAAPSSAAQASSPPSVSTEDTDVGWATPGPPPAIPAFLDSPEGLPSSSTDPIAAARRKSRRTMKSPDEASPLKAALSAESTERSSAPPQIAEPPVARAQASSSPWLDGFPTEAPQEAPIAPVIEAAAPAASVAVHDTSNDVIQPMRIISIGTDTSPLPREEAHAPPPAPPAAAALRAPVDIVVEEVEAFDAIEDDEPDTVPGLARDARATTARSSVEIDQERIPDVSIPTIDAVALGPNSSGPTSVGPKKPPPPPPPKIRASIEPSAIPATPPPVVATFTASAPPAVASVPQTPPPPVAPPAAAAAPVSAPPLDPLRKRQKPWWEELFGDDYLRTMDKVDPKVVRKECDFIEDRLGLEKGAVMLDLACGPGAHAVELASRGYSLVGYDLSLAMLARAADEAQDRGQKLNFLQGDMREMAFEDTFDGVYCWQTSFGYFDDEKNVNVLQRIHRSLRKGGMLLLDVINHDYVAPRQPSLVWFEGDGCVCMDEMSVDFFTSRLRVKRTVMFEDGRAREVDYTIRLYALHELGKMLHECGFKVIEVTGHPAHPGVFFGSESPRVIVLAERSEHE